MKNKDLQEGSYFNLLPNVLKNMVLCLAIRDGGSPGDILSVCKDWYQVFQKYTLGQFTDQFNNSEFKKSSKKRKASEIEENNEGNFLIGLSEIFQVAKKMVTIELKFRISQRSTSVEEYCLKGAVERPILTFNELESFSKIEAPSIRALLVLWTNINQTKKFPNWKNKSLKEVKELLSFKNFKDLSSIRVISLADRQLTVLPQEIMNFLQLEYLNLSGNHFTSIPIEIKSLKTIKSLKLSKNPGLSFDEKSLSALFDWLPNLNNLYISEGQKKLLDPNILLQPRFIRKIFAE